MSDRPCIGETKLIVGRTQERCFSRWDFVVCGTGLHMNMYMKEIE